MSFQQDCQARAQTAHAALERLSQIASPTAAQIREVLMLFHDPYVWLAEFDRRGNVDLTNAMIAYRLLDEHEKAKTREMLEKVDGVLYLDKTAWEAEVRKHGLPVEHDPKLNALRCILPGMPDAAWYFLDFKEGVIRRAALSGSSSS